MSETSVGEDSAQVLGAVNRDDEIMDANVDSPVGDAFDLHFLQKLNTLSAREKRIFSLWLGDMKSREIAVRLSISERTVKSQKKKILEKMEVESIVQMALSMPRSSDETARELLGRIDRWLNSP